MIEILPESQLSGLSGSGWAIKAIIALQTDWSVHAGLQAFFRISRQISPVYTLIESKSRIKKIKIKTHIWDPYTCRVLSLFDLMEKNDLSKKV